MTNDRVFDALLAAGKISLEERAEADRNPEYARSLAGTFMFAFMRFELAGRDVFEAALGRSRNGSH